MRGPECRCDRRTRKLEEKKTFAARGIDFVPQWWNVRQIASLESSHWILDEKTTGFFFSELLSDEIESGLEFKRPSAHVVSIASHEVDQSVGHPAPGILLRSGAKPSRQGARRHL
jgi:hypothetical protein